MKPTKQTPQTKNQNSDQPRTETPEVPQMYPFKELSTEHNDCL